MKESSGADKKQIIKDIIKRLHQGAKPDEVKAQFKEILQGVGPVDIARIEEELIKEGMPQEEIHKLCDVHLAVFKESLDKEQFLAPAGHPIHILMEEHKMLLKFAGLLKNLAKDIKGVKDAQDAGEHLTHLGHVVQHFKESEKHYLREENVLFPYLEKHGITQPPAMMWAEHDKIREIKKGLYNLFDNLGKMPFQNFTRQLTEIDQSLFEMLQNHFYKENNILFTTALKVIGENEWLEIRSQFDELGYCCFTPEPARKPMETKASPPVQPELKGVINLETGNLTVEEIETIFNTLPVDISYVDKNDTVRYFSQTKERIFPRTKAVLGRQVQQCHPQKSVHMVNQILDDFRHRRSDIAEFWLPVQGRLIYIRYFAARNKQGEYLGCLEVTQDITDIKKIAGAKTLL